MRRLAGASSLVMYHSIRPDLYFARAGGRIIFLDARANRYFAVAPVVEPDISRLESGLALAQDSPLVRAGLVVAADKPFARMPIPDPPRESLLDETVAPRAGMVASLACRFLMARFSVAGARRRLPRFPQIDPSAFPPDDLSLRQIASAYERASRLVGAHDLCLPWSLALARLCRKRGHDVSCIIGVAARPFNAHCWVQTGTRLVNDRHDHVRNFTPILVL